MLFRENGKNCQMSTIGWYLGWWLGIGASRVIVWGLCMIDTQLSTLGVERKSLSHNKLAIFRVVVSPTLKMANLLIVCYLRITTKCVVLKKVYQKK